MKKVRLEQRLEKARAAFFADEALKENDLLRIVNDSEFLKENSSIILSRQCVISREVLKQIFLYFPGVFLLWASTLALSFNYFVWQPQNFLKIIALIISSIMMTSGIGNLTNPKHSIIPFPGVAVCVAMFILSLWTDGQYFLVKNAIYCFPLMLIVPFLAKGWVDGRSNKLS